MQIVFDFVEGKVSYDEFMKEWYANAEILNWIESIIDIEGLKRVKSELRPPVEDYASKIQDEEFVLKDEIESNDALHNWGGQLNIHGWISAILKGKYPDVVVTEKYIDDFDFLLDAQGDFIGGEEVDSFIEKVLEKIPESMGKTKRLKTAKQELRELFHIKLRHLPYWAQEPEWPMGKNSPMEYISTSKDGERRLYKFRDVDTGEVREIEQFY